MRGVVEWIRMGVLIPVGDRSKNMTPLSVRRKKYGTPSKQLKFQKRPPLTPTAHPSYHQPFASHTRGGLRGERVGNWACN